MTRTTAGKASNETAIDGLQKILVLLCVSIPSFMINLDSNIVAVSLPSIARSLKADFAGIEWVISAYTLTFASLVLPAGALADCFGRKRMLLIGLAIFTLASVACGAAPGVTTLNAARAVQGVGAALQLSAALATLSHVFRGVERARAFAFWGSVIGIAIALGPVAGGVITQSLGWEWAFYINVPVGVLMLALTIHSVKDSRDPDAKRVDWPGFITFSSTLSFITLALISGNRMGWTSPSIFLEFVATAILFVAFLVVESVQQRPMLDLGLFRRPTYIGANIAAITYAVSLLTILTYLPIYFQSGLGYSPKDAGLMMLPMAAPLFLVPRIIASQLTHRLSGRAILVIGLVLAAAGLLWMGNMVRHFDYPDMLGGMVVAGIGAGFLNGEIAKVGMSVVPPERAGMASGISGTMRFSGIVVGFAALGAILFSRISSSVAAGLGEGVDRSEFVRNIASGDLSGIGSGITMDTKALHAIALKGFGDGYQAIFLAAALFATTAAILTWLLVRSSETAPTPRSTPTVAHASIE